MGISFMLDFWIVCDSLLSGYVCYFFINENEFLVGFRKLVVLLCGFVNICYFVGGSGGSSLVFLLFVRVLVCSVFLVLVFLSSFSWRVWLRGYVDVGGCIWFFIFYWVVCFKGKSCLCLLKFFVYLRMILCLIWICKGKYTSFLILWKNI